ncbi:MAG: hypothetical protein R3272_03180 [Candidatus Promineifilaceae bacterium]|nr:hypothetical protein [Candidatus Promineifilaceae bacterium]
MKSFETWRTWLIILGLILFSALASVAYLALDDGVGDDDPEGGIASEALIGDVVPDITFPFIGDRPPREETLITIELEDLLLGEVLVEAPLIGELQGRQVDPLVLAGIIAVIVVGALFAMGLPLGFLYVLLDRQTTTLKADPEFQEHQAELERRERALIKELAEKQPPTPVPEHERPAWAWVSTALIFFVLAIFFGFALADTFFPSGEAEFFNRPIYSPGVPLGLILGLIALIALSGVYRMGRPAEGTEAAKADDRPIPWGTIWVIITGLVFLAIGTGLMLAVRATPPPG